MKPHPSHTPTLTALASIPILAALYVWLSPLAFSPVPWPDDSAFYFVAHELFKWPPRWVMLPQAPFEPTYAQMNFNTMPLYPILIGLARFLGIDGTFALKILPLGAWALTGALAAIALFRRGLPTLAALLIGLLFALDPVLRWASVLIRPESLIGLFGTMIVLGLSLGYPKRFQPRGLWDPTAALLALAAYAHFNSIHLLFPVILAFIVRPRELLRIGLKTALYLSPWLLLVATHPLLFLHQMSVQWARLAVGNDWLSHPLTSIFQDMGSPENLPFPLLRYAGIVIWLLMAAALAWGLAYPLAVKGYDLWLKKRVVHEKEVDLLPASGWILGAAWLWHTKPEVWFTYYLHAAVWLFTGLAALRLHKMRGMRKWAHALLALTLPVLGIFAYVDVDQNLKLARSPSWRWSTYDSFIDCIDRQLTAYETKLGNPKPFRVWAPTFPDITIELSRRHRDWALTRTNDFWDRQDLAIEHGHAVEAVVVPETINREERVIDAAASENPNVESIWMTWESYFLNRLWKDPHWKPNRWICQKGRWAGFIFMR